MCAFLPLSLGSFISGVADSYSQSLAPCPANMKRNPQKKADREQNSAFKMYNIVVADLIESLFFPNAAYSLRLDSIEIVAQISATP